MAAPHQCGQVCWKRTLEAWSLGSCSKAWHDGMVGCAGKAGTLVRQVVHPKWGVWTTRTVLAGLSQWIIAYTLHKYQVAHPQEYWSCFPLVVGCDTIPRLFFCLSLALFCWAVFMCHEWEVARALTADLCHSKIPLCRQQKKWILPRPFSKPDPNSRGLCLQNRYSISNCPYTWKTAGK